MKIAHLADIHWRGIARHHEYQKAFEEFFEKLKEEIKPDIIFVCGDIYHTKINGITPEVINYMAWMFKEMSEIAPTHVILGNHDGNLQNKERINTIRPIIKAIHSPKLILHDKSCNEIITVKNQLINLGIYSLFDKENWNNVIPAQDQNTINIALYHGYVKGTIISESCKEDINGLDKTFFSGYDFVLLGDIHKRQFVDYRQDKNGILKPYIAYPGSFIQQNHGEELEKGFLVWNIKEKNDWDIETYNITNRNPYLTIEWSNVENVLNIIEKTLQEKNIQKEKLIGLRCRFVSEQHIPNTEIKRAHNIIENSFGPTEISVKILENNKNSHYSIEINNEKFDKFDIRNNFNSLFQLFLEYTKNQQAIVFNEEQAKEKINKYFLLFKKNEQYAARNITWTIEELQFSNLFRYEDNNYIDFRNLNGITGILGSNRIGKSSIIGAIMYAIFNLSDRDGIRLNNIIHNGKDYCSSRAIIAVNKNNENNIERYVIERTTKKSRKGTSTELNFYQLFDNGQQKILNGSSRDETDKIIRKIIGNPEDFLITSLSNQGNITAFINEGTAQRKTILCKFLDLDVFEKLLSFIKDDYYMIKTQINQYSNTNYDVEKEKTQKELENINTEIEKTNQNIQDLIAQRENLNNLLNNIDKTNIEKHISELKSINEEIEKIEIDLKAIQQREKTSRNFIDKLNSEIENLENDIKDIDLNHLKEKYQNMKLLIDKFNSIKLSYEKNKTVLENKEKSVNKLAVVPCGDQYPECIFIKDSHEDKKTIEQQREFVKNLFNQLLDVTIELEKYKKEQIEEKINQYEKIHGVLQIKRNQITNELDKISDFEMIKNKLLSSAQTLKDKKEKIENIISGYDINTYEQNKLLLHKLNFQIEQNQKQLNNLHVKQQLIINQLNNLEKAQEKYVTLLEELKLIEIIKNAFDRNGIPTFILNKSLPLINSKLRKLLNNIVEFNVYLEMNGNDIDIFIEDESEKRVIETASGMEKMITSLALRIVLTELGSLPKTDFMIIDEGFGVLDENNLYKCYEFLSSLKEKFRNIIIITHDNTLKELTDNILEIQDKGTYSYVNNKHE